VTTIDAGGPNEFVTDGVTGCVVTPDGPTIGEALAGLDRDRRRAARLGEAGYDLARGITWSGVIERLTSAGA
jgi:glycosyltransferase involved in cell wall biosynthesis